MALCLEPKAGGRVALMSSRQRFIALASWQPVAVDYPVTVCRVRRQGQACPPRTLRASTPSVPTCPTGCAATTRQQFGANLGARLTVDILHALALLAILQVAAPLALHVPLAALGGILLFVAWNMGEWREFARLKHFLLSYRATLLGTFALTVVLDLILAAEVEVEVDVEVG